MAIVFCWVAALEGTGVWIVLLLAGFGFGFVLGPVRVLFEERHGDCRTMKVAPLIGEQRCLKN